VNFTGDTYQYANYLLQFGGKSERMILVNGFPPLVFFGLFFDCVLESAMECSNKNVPSYTALHDIMCILKKIVDQGGNRVEKDKRGERD
jgi:hypothetical protein